MSNENGGHWYTTTGEPMHQVPRVKGGGMRATTLADARKLNLLPSVTTILKALDKPALTRWLVTQAVHAVTTAPDVPGESLDAKIERVLVTEAQADEEAARARDLGTNIHTALELYLGGQPDRVAPDLLPWIEPAAKYVQTLGEVVSSEQVVIGDGYAGRVDLVIRTPVGLELTDFKSSKTMPKKEAWPEHRLQGAAYAHAYPEAITATSNIYVSTTECGLFVHWVHVEPWQMVFSSAFEPLVRVWQWMNCYWPAPPIQEA